MDVKFHENIFPCNSHAFTQSFFQPQPIIIPNLQATTHTHIDDDQGLDTVTRPESPTTTNEPPILESPAPIPEPTVTPTKP